MATTQKSKGASHADEDVLRPEEVDPLEVLETMETALRSAVRGLRGKVLRNVDPEKPTMLESAAGERPVLAASAALASGFALGLVVRRLIPWKLK